MFLFFCLENQNLLAQSKTTDSLLATLQLVKNDTTRCSILNIIVETDPEEKIWVKYNWQMKNIAEKNLKNLTANDSLLKKVFLKYLSTSLNNFGYLSDSRGNFTEALDYYNRSLKIMYEISNKEGIAICLNNIGFIYDNQGNITMALDHYSKSLKIQEQIGNKRGIAQSYNNIASIYEHQHDIEKALEYYNNSLKIKNTIGDKAGTATTLNNIGHVYVIKQDYNKALLYFEKSLEIHTEIKNKNGICTALNNIADIYKNEGNYDKALELNLESLKKAEEAEDKESILSCLNNIGELYFFKKENSKALHYILKATELNKQIGYAENIKGSALLLYQIYKAQNDFKNAFQNYELYIQLRDSISNQETKKATYKSQLKYDYEKKAAADSVKIAEEKKLTSLQLKQEENQRYYLYFGLALTLLFGGFMFNRFRITKKQKSIIEQQKVQVEKQKHLVEEKQKEVLDSIRYAKRIQHSLLPNENYFKKHIPKS